MNNYQNLQKAVDYIEENLSEPICLADVSSAAFSSLSHFHRIFYFLTGYTLKEYIRKRRLSQAAFQIHCSDRPILEIALQAGYETSESFSRAFKKQFSVGPRKFRQLQAEQVLEPKLDVLQQFLTQPEPMLDFKLDLNYVLYQQKTVCGFQTHTTIEGGQQAIDICNFSNDILVSGKLANYFDLSQLDLFGMYTEMKDESDFDYTIGCLQQAALKSTADLVTHIIPSAQYARFSLNRMDRIKEAWRYIYGHWFLKHDAERAKGFDFEIYHQNSVDIYIPVN